MSLPVEMTWSAVSSLCSLGNFLYLVPGLAPMATPFSGQVPLPSKLSGVHGFDRAQTEMGPSISAESKNRLPSFLTYFAVSDMQQKTTFARGGTLGNKI